MTFFTKDNIYPLLIGGLSFVFLFFLSGNIASSFSYDLEGGALVFAAAVLLPFLSFLLVKLAAYGVRYVASLLQISKFALVGILNTLVDIGIFNILAAMFSPAAIGLQTLFKAISFGAAVVNSYFFNSTWVFEREEQKGSLLGEFISFLAVSVGGLVVNVVAFLIFSSLLGAVLSLPALVVSTMAALLASVTSLLFNFLGYKFIVFT